MARGRRKVAECIVNLRASRIGHFLALADELLGSFLSLLVKCLLR
jgi:hypothetical protein